MRWAALSFLVPMLAFGQAKIGASVQTSRQLVGGPGAAASAAFYVRPDGGVALLVNNQAPSQNEGVQSYDLNGTFLETRQTGEQLAVDVRYDFGFPTKRDVILVVDQFGSISLCKPDPMTGLLFGPSATDGSSTLATNRSATSAALGWHQDKLFAYVGTSSGLLDQWLITPISDDTLNITKQGTVAVGAGSAINAIVADETTDTLFLSIDSFGLVSLPMLVDGGLAEFKFLDAGVLAPPSGLSLYLQSDGGAELLASDRINGLIEVFDRSGTFRGSFQIVTDGGIQGVTAPVGNAVLMMDAGTPPFARGAFAVVDAQDPAGPFVKLVPWPTIAAAFTPPLVVDTAFDVRQLPHTKPVPMMVCDAGSSDGGDDGGTDAGSGGCNPGTGGGSGGTGGGSGTGGNHIPNPMATPYEGKPCGCDAGGGALLGALCLLGLALRRKLR